MRDQLLWRRRPRIIHVILDGEIVAHLDLLFGDNSPRATGCLGKVVVRPGQLEADVFAAVDFFIPQAVG